MSACLRGPCEFCAPDAYHHCRRPSGHGGFCSCELTDEDGAA